MHVVCILTATQAQETNFQIYQYLSLAALQISYTSRLEASIGTGTTQLQGSRATRAMALGASGYGRHGSTQIGHPCRW